jgi:hypothetical protein
MEKAMDEKEFHFIHEIKMAGQGVAGGRFDGKDDIPQDLRMDVAELALRHRKRDHIGWAISFKIILIDLPDLIVIDQKKANFAAFAVEFLQKPLQASPHPADIYLLLFLPILN